MTNFVLAVVVVASIPNPAFTPGAVRPLSKTTICAINWGRDQRHVSDAKKKQVAEWYGLAWADRSQVEFDHRIPRALGGDDLAANLWPEPLWEAKHLKDPLEVKLWKMVCNGSVGLVEAQTAFLKDWRVAYRKYVGAMPPRFQGATP